MPAGPEQSMEQIPQCTTLIILTSRRTMIDYGNMVATGGKSQQTPCNPAHHDSAHQLRRAEIMTCHKQTTLQINDIISSYCTSD